MCVRGGYQVRQRTSGTSGLGGEAPGGSGLLIAGESRGPPSADSGVGEPWLPCAGDSAAAGRSGSERRDGGAQRTTMLWKRLDLSRRLKSESVLEKWTESRPAFEAMSVEARTAFSSSEALILR